MVDQDTAARLSAAEAKARLLEEDPLEAGNEAVRHFVKAHPLAATGIALAAGLVLTRSRLLRSAAIPAVMLLVKRLL